jgi:hypothetical protein
MNHPSFDLTRELLSCGVFNHLPDNEITRLHWIILKDPWPETMDSLEILLGYWYKGDYYSSNIHPRLLQQCNEFLQRIGRPMIDVNMEEFFEA